MSVVRLSTVCVLLFLNFESNSTSILTLNMTQQNHSRVVAVKEWPNEWKQDVKIKLFLNLCTVTNIIEPLDSFWQNCCLFSLTFVLLWPSTGIKNYRDSDGCCSNKLSYCYPLKINTVLMACESFYCYPSKFWCYPWTINNLCYICSIRHSLSAVDAGKGVSTKIWNWIDSKLLRNQHQWIEKILRQPL